MRFYTIKINLVPLLLCRIADRCSADYSGLDYCWNKKLELIRKTIQQVKKGTIYTIPNHHTDKVNKRLKKINPHFHNEYIFCNSGTEANMRAIRLARAYTKKDTIGRFHGGWHGGLDGCIEGDGVPSKTNSLFNSKF